MTEFKFYDRPWGGYLILPENYGAVGPLKNPNKFLFILPGEQLSWQYHNYRAEEWYVLEGDLEINLSKNDTLNMWTPCPHNQYYYIDVEERHSCRNVGNSMGIIAETWVEKGGQTSEADIIRVSDKYKR